jgi:hypothetical protein
MVAERKAKIVVHVDKTSGGDLASLPLPSCPSGQNQNV